MKVSLPYFIAEAIADELYGDTKHKAVEAYIDSDTGELHLDVNVFPCKAVEFITLNFIAVNSDISFDEVVKGTNESRTNH